MKSGPPIVGTRVLLLERQGNGVGIDGTDRVLRVIRWSRINSWILQVRMRI